MKKSMRTYTRAIVLAAGFIVAGSSIVHAQTVSSYLEDKADTSMRVEVTFPGAPDRSQQNAGFLGTLRKFLGIRKKVVLKPEVGTKFTVNSSAYAPSPYQTDSTPCTTASGTTVRPGVVATNFLPLGTILEINGHEFIVEDRMNPRYDGGYYVDVWFPSTSRALEFGRRELEITVVRYGVPGEEIREVNEIKQGESNGAQQNEEKNFWDTVKEQVATLSGLLTTRKNVDQYDVDCLKEGE